MPNGAQHNIDDARRALREIPQALPVFMHQVARFANTRIGFTATTKYMHGLNSPGKQTGRASRTSRIGPNNTDRLRRLTGKLARSVTMGGFTAGQQPSITSRAGIGRPGPAGKAREGFVNITMEPGPRLRMEKGTEVLYAYIHEHGGTIRIPVTPKARRFFWAMWYETGDDKWKGMALTKKTVFTLNMPARPYLGPALTDEHPRIQAFADDRFAPFLDEQLRRFLP